MGPRRLAVGSGKHADRFGLELFDGFFGPLPQDNRSLASDTWADFYAERRVLPRLRSAVDSGNLPPEVALEIERLVRRLPALCGPEPQPALLHGDAQQNNFLSNVSGAVLIDPAPYFGHPGYDLALVDYFHAVPASLFDAYQEVLTIDPGFDGRRELWRVAGYLAVVAVDGGNAFGLGIVPRLLDALGTYR